MDPDGVTAPPSTFRCFGSGTEIYERYHDQEWGRPVLGEQALFERLCLESFQSGLSWLVILRKREGFRRAFADFDPAIVAGYGPGDVERLLATTEIVRNRAKIDATITNAAATLALPGQGLSLRDMLWGLRPDDAAPAEHLSDLPAFSAATTTLARQMKRLGFRFLGRGHNLLRRCALLYHRVRGDAALTELLRDPVQVRRGLVDVGGLDERGRLALANRAALTPVGIRCVNDAQECDLRPHALGEVDCMRDHSLRTRGPIEGNQKMLEHDCSPPDRIRALPARLR